MAEKKLWLAYLWYYVIFVWYERRKRKKSSCLTLFWKEEILLQVEKQVKILFLPENRVNPWYYPFCLGKQENYQKSLKLHNWKTCSFTECFCKSLLLLPPIILLFYTCFSLPTSLSSNHASMIVKLYSIWYFSNAFFLLCLR